ncbi:SemiSWEET family sugar transporter [Lysobacter korlensis]|uniref:SemiSWEET family sugar transporter n=1 Tax=Lysobacter korlensis TaxID=553636 RepID=A0ABV6RV35_9GAMM
MVVDVLGICAGTWGVVMAIAPGMQLRKMVRTRNARDVSLRFFGLLLPGYVLWVSYGVARGDPALIVPNAVAFCVAIATMLVAVHFRRNPGAPATRPDAAVEGSSA